MNRKAKLVYLDPRFTVTAAKADEWYPIRPGTDLAFILALLHVIIGEERYDKEFVAERCLGFEELRAHVAALHAGVGRGRDRDPGRGHRPHRPRVRRCRAPRGVLRGPSLLLVLQRLPDAAGAGDPQRHRRQLGPRGRRWSPTRKIALGELPLPALGRARRRRGSTRSTPASRSRPRATASSCRRARTCSPECPTRSRAGWSTSRTPMNALPDRARTLQMIERHGLRRRHRHPALRHRLVRRRGASRSRPTSSGSTRCTCCPASGRWW